MTITELKHRLMRALDMRSWLVACLRHRTLAVACIKEATAAERWNTFSMRMQTAHPQPFDLLHASGRNLTSVRTVSRQILALCCAEQTHSCSFTVDQRIYYGNESVDNTEELWTELSKPGRCVRVFSLSSPPPDLPAWQEDPYTKAFSSFDAKPRKACFQAPNCRQPWISYILPALRISDGRRILGQILGRTRLFPQLPLAKLLPFEATRFYIVVVISPGRSYSSDPRATQPREPVTEETIPGLAAGNDSPGNNEDRLIPMIPTTCPGTDGSIDLENGASDAGISNPNRTIWNLDGVRMSCNASPRPLQTRTAYKSRSMGASSSDKKHSLGPFSSLDLEKKLRRICIHMGSPAFPIDDPGLPRKEATEAAALSESDGLIAIPVINLPPHAILSTTRRMSKACADDDTL